MSIPTIVVLYSRYSAKSKYLFDNMSDPTIQSIQSICVDNPDIRRIIAQSNLIKVTELPCALQTLPSGVINKFEGDKCLNFFRVPLPALEEPPRVVNKTPIERVVQDDVPQEQPQEAKQQKEERPKNPRVALSSVRMEPPVRGEGHENFRTSSLSEGAQEELAPRKGGMDRERQSNITHSQTDVSKLTELSEMPERDDISPKRMTVKDMASHIEKAREEPKRGPPAQTPRTPPKMKKVTFDE